MREIRIKNVPQELKDLLAMEAKRLGMDVRAVALMRLWGIDKAPYQGAGKTEVAPDESRTVLRTEESPGIQLTKEEIEARRPAEREEIERVRRQMEEH